MMSGVMKPERELSVKEIVSRSFNLYSTRFIDFLTPYLLAALITGSLTMIVYEILPLPPTPQPSAPLEEFSRLLSRFLLVGFVSLIVGTIVSGLTVKYASDLMERGEASLQAGFSFTVARFTSLLAAGLIIGFSVILGAFCFIVPGIIFIIIFTLVTPVIIIERLGVLESLRRSRRLVSKRWGKTLVLILILDTIVGVTAGVATILVKPLGPAGPIASNLLTAGIQPLTPIASTLLYYSMTAKEAATAQPLRLCLHCGHQTPPDAVFCPQCGKKIEGRDEKETLTEPASQTHALKPFG